MEERFLDGQLVEVALTPREARLVRFGAARMRKSLEWLRAAIAHPDFDGDTALAVIDRALQVPDQEQTRGALP